MKRCTDYRIKACDVILLSENETEREEFERQEQKQLADSRYREAAVLIESLTKGNYLRLSGNDSFASNP